MPGISRTARLVSSRGPWFVEEFTVSSLLKKGARASSPPHTATFKKDRASGHAQIHALPTCPIGRESRPTCHVCGSQTRAPERCRPQIDAAAKGDAKTMERRPRALRTEHLQKELASLAIHRA
mmetsp:Transcript_1321/g.3388  ORF Transcript_1321/g.3388 Transcript_1321/m.3388 type:complete len:123 (-) Transcript_1321:136-504(-)